MYNIDREKEVGMKKFIIFIGVLFLVISIVATVTGAVDTLTGIILTAGYLVVLLIVRRVT